jgi:transposase
MNRDDLQRLSKDDLIELVLRLQRPDKTSRTSSKPNRHRAMHSRDAQVDAARKITASATHHGDARPRPPSRQMAVSPR